MNLSDCKRVTGEGDTHQTDLWAGSKGGAEHFLRLHSAEAVERGILIRHRGVWLGHRVLFPEFVVEVAQRMARRAVERARASDVARIAA